MLRKTKKKKNKNNNSRNRNAFALLSFYVSAIFGIKVKVLNKTTDETAIPLFHLNVNSDNSICETFYLHGNQLNDRAMELFRKFYAIYV